MAGTGSYEALITVRPEQDLADLVPAYLVRRTGDVAALRDALLLGDVATVQSLGHSMKGSGGGYGFDGITEIGRRLEDAGRGADTGSARLAIEDLEDYLRNVEVHYD